MLIALLSVLFIAFGIASRALCLRHIAYKPNGIKQLWYCRKFQCRSCDNIIPHYRYAWWHITNYPSENPFQCGECMDQRKTGEWHDVWMLTQKGYIKATGQEL